MEYGIFLVIIAFSSFIVALLSLHCANNNCDYKEKIKPRRTIIIRLGSLLLNCPFYCLFSMYSRRVDQRQLKIILFDE